MNSDQLAVTSEESPQEETNSPQENETDGAGSMGERSEPDVPPKTQGVRVSPGGGAAVLAPAAERAARSGRRNDVHEYMRLRRSYV